MEEKKLAKRVIEESQNLGLKNICTETERVMKEHEIDLTNGLGNIQHLFSVKGNKDSITEKNVYNNS